LNSWGGGYFNRFLVLFLQDMSPVTGFAFCLLPLFKVTALKGHDGYLEVEGQKQDSFINILKIQSFIYEVCEVF